MAAAKKQKQLNGPRVELAILFHSETSHPLVSWSRIALRITRTRRSRRKSIHRTTSERFPSNCVVAGRLGATIGRSPKCDIFIDDLTAANFHAQVVYVQDGYVLQTIADPDYFGTFILLGRKSFRASLPPLLHRTAPSRRLPSPVLTAAVRRCVVSSSH